MQPDPNQSPAPPAETPASSAPGSATTATSEGPSANGHDFDSIFAAAMAGLPADDPRETTDPSASKEGSEPAPATAATDDKAADPGVTSSTEPGDGTEGQPETGDKPLSRRQQIAAEKDARIAELEQQVAAADPEQIKASLREELRAEIEAENAKAAEDARAAQLTASQRAEFDRYQRLNALPDDHPTLNEDDNYAWLQEYKRRLSSEPEIREHVERHYRQEAERVVAEQQAQIDAQNGAFWVGVRAEITAAAEQHGVDPNRWKQSGVTWTQMASDIGDAREARGKAEAEKALLARVEQAEADAAAARKEADELRLASLGSTRAPANVGRSASVANERPTANPSGSFEDNMAAAFGWGQR